MKVIGIVEEAISDQIYLIRTENATVAIKAKTTLDVKTTYIFKEVVEELAGSMIYDSVGKIVSYKDANFPEVDQQRKEEILQQFQLKEPIQNKRNLQENIVEVRPLEEVLGDEKNDKGVDVKKPVVGIVKNPGVKIKKKEDKRAYKLIEVRGVNGDDVSIYLNGTLVDEYLKRGDIIMLENLKNTKMNILPGQKYRRLATDYKSKIVFLNGSPSEEMFINTPLGDLRSEGTIEGVTKVAFYFSCKRCKLGLGQDTGGEPTLCKRCDFSDIPEKDCRVDLNICMPDNNEITLTVFKSELKFLTEETMADEKQVTRAVSNELCDKWIKFDADKTDLKYTGGEEKYTMVTWSVMKDMDEQLANIAETLETENEIKENNHSNNNSDDNIQDENENESLSREKSNPKRNNEDKTLEISSTSESSEEEEKEETETRNRRKIKRSGPFSFLPSKKSKPSAK